MRRNEIWDPSPSDVATLRRTVAGRLKRTMPTVRPGAIDEKIEEIVQEGFMQYLETINDPNADFIEKPAHWVANASLNKGMNVIQRGHVRWTRETATDSEGMEVASMNSSSVEGRTMGAIDPLGRILNAEAMATLFAAIRTLTATQLEVFVKVDIDKERQTDVAKDMNKRVGSIEKVLDAARARVWWIVAKSNYDGLCPEFYTLTPGLEESDRPTKQQTTIIARHVRTCDMCRASICDSPLAIDLGAVVGAGLVGGGGTATFLGRISDSPIIAKPLSVLDSAASSVKHGFGRMMPGGGSGQAADAAASGAGVGSVGGAALAIGGGKIAAICAGGAVTACLAGVATGVVHLPEQQSQRDRDREFVEKQVATETQQAAAIQAPPVVDPRVVSRQITVDKRQAEVRKEKIVEKRQAKQRAVEKTQKKEAAAAAQAEAVTAQAETDSSSTDASFGFGGDSGVSSSSGSTSSSSSSSSSSGSGTTSTAPTPQQQTDQSTADASFGCC